MKRFLSLLLAAALLLSLAACGGSGSSGAGIGNLVGNSSSTPKVSYTDLLKIAPADALAAGTLTEHTGYSSLQIDGLDWESATSYRNDLFGEVNWADLGFYHNENDHLECGTEYTKSHYIVRQQKKSLTWLFSLTRKSLLNPLGALSNRTNFFS